MKFPERLHLAQTPTPLQHLDSVSRQLGRDVWLWRDDLTGFVESGNKIRKLEFLLAEAVAQEATEIITCGGPQSNHARATVAMARKLRMTVRIVIREPEGGRPNSLQQGNHLLMRMAGAQITWVPFLEYQQAGNSYASFLQAAADTAKSQGKTPYVIAEGGSSYLGTMGYIRAAAELKANWKETSPPSLVCALGSGGTHAGLVLGYAQNHWDPEQVFGVNVCDDRVYFEKRVGRLIEETCERFSIHAVPKQLNVLDGYVGQGYAQATDDDLTFYMRLFAAEGVLLDPVYTGKAFQGMLAEVKRDGGRFGNHIVFLHSGGQFANFAWGERYSRLIASG